MTTPFDASFGESDLADKTNNSWLQKLNTGWKSLRKMWERFESEQQIVPWVPKITALGGTMTFTYSLPGFQGGFYTVENGWLECHGLLAATFIAPLSGSFTVGFPGGIGLNPLITQQENKAISYRGITMPLLMRENPPNLTFELGGLSVTNSGLVVVRNSTAATFTVNQWFFWINARYPIDPREAPFKS